MVAQRYSVRNATVARMAGGGAGFFEQPRISFCLDL